MSGATVDKKREYSSSPSSSTRKSGISLYISQTVFRAQIFQKLMLMGHFALEEIPWPKQEAALEPKLLFLGLKSSLSV